MKAVLVKTQTGLIGATPDDQAEWDKFKAKLDRMRPGESLTLEWELPRSPDQHRKYFALLKLITDNSEVFNTKEKAVVAVKTAAAFFNPVVDVETGNVRCDPYSTAYASMEQCVFERFFDQALTAMCDHILPTHFDEATARKLVDNMLAEWSTAGRRPA